jgi:hypothetical protein
MRLESPHGLTQRRLLLGLMTDVDPRVHERLFCRRPIQQ